MACKILGLAKSFFDLQQSLWACILSNGLANLILDVRHSFLDMHNEVCQLYLGLGYVDQDPLILWFS